MNHIIHPKSELALEVHSRIDIFFPGQQIPRNSQETPHTLDFSFDMKVKVILTSIFLLQVIALPAVKKRGKWIRLPTSDAPAQRADLV